MAATAGVGAFGTDIRMYIAGGGGGGSYLSIGEVKDLTGPQIASEYVDYTTFQSPQGFRERKATYKSSGEIRFRCNYLHGNATHTALVTAASADPATLTAFHLVFPDQSEFHFSAYVGLDWTAPLNGPLEMTVTLALTGALEWVAPSPSVSPSASASTS